MQVNGSWLVTNLLTETRADVVLVGVHLKLPWRLRLKLDGDLS